MSYSRENNEVSASGEDMVNAMRGYKAWAPHSSIDLQHD